MKKIFNSVFEISVRAVLVLEASDKPLTVDMIAAADFITVYGQDFAVSTDNLNGDNVFRYSEFSLRRELVEKAIKSLTLDGLLKIKISSRGFAYSLNNNGKIFASRLAYEYAQEYRAIAQKTLLYLSDKTERQIIKEITERSVAACKRRGDE